MLFLLLCEHHALTDCALPPAQLQILQCAQYTPHQHSHSLFLVLLLLKLRPQLVAKVLSEVLIIHVLRLLGADIIWHHLQQKLLKRQRSCCWTVPTTATATAAFTTRRPVITPAPAQTQPEAHVPLSIE